MYETTGKNWLVRIVHFDDSVVVYSVPEPLNRMHPEFMLHVYGIIMEHIRRKYDVEVPVFRDGYPVFEELEKYIKDYSLNHMPTQVYHFGKDTVRIEVSDGNVFIYWKSPEGDGDVRMYREDDWIYGVSGGGVFPVIALED